MNALDLGECNDISYVFKILPAKASQQRIDALRRRLSNLANGSAPEAEVPGAPFTAQSSGSYSAGNPCEVLPSPDKCSPPYGRYHERENPLMETPPVAPEMTLELTLPDPEPATTCVAPEPVATLPEPVATPRESVATPPVATPPVATPPEPVATPPKAAPITCEPGLVTPEACAPAPSPATEVDDEPGIGDSVSACGEMPPPSNPYWKFLGILQTSMNPGRAWGNPFLPIIYHHKSIMTW